MLHLHWPTFRPLLHFFGTLSPSCSGSAMPLSLDTLDAFLALFLGFFLDGISGISSSEKTLKDKSVLSWSLPISESKKIEGKQTFQKMSSSEMLRTPLQIFPDLFALVKCTKCLKLINLNCLIEFVSEHSPPLM